MTQLEKIRLNQELTQLDLAHKVGISVSVINGVEKGIKDMNGRTWKRTAEVLNVSVDELLKDF